MDWVRVLQMEEKVVLNFSVFVGHGFVQQVGYGWKGHQKLRNCTAVILKGTCR